MSETLVNMERRLVAVERELADVRERLRVLMPGEEVPGVRHLRTKEKGTAGDAM